MFTRFDKNIADAIKEYKLAFTCEQCAYFIEEEQVCSMLYPISEHSQQRFLSLQEGDRLRFCKMFEAK